MRRLEKYIEKQLPGQNAFVPTNGCPGPEVVDVAPLVRLVAINTPWFTHPFDRPEAPDTDCKTLTKEEFREQLQDIIDDTKGKNVLLVGHHPVISNGVYGGSQPLARHLSPPVLGTIYAAYRQNVGSPRDLANPRYQELRREMLNTLQSNPGVVYAAAHDYQPAAHAVSGQLPPGKRQLRRKPARGRQRRSPCTARAKKATPRLNTLPMATSKRTFTPSAARPAGQRSLTRPRCFARPAPRAATAHAPPIAFITRLPRHGATAAEAQARRAFSGHHHRGARP